RRILMKKFLLTMLTLFAVLTLAACGSNSDKEENKSSGSNEKSGEVVTSLDKDIEIEFWHAMSGGHEEALEKITNDFNESQEHITVKLVNQGSYSDLSTKIMAAAKANTLPVLTQAYED